MIKVSQQVHALFRDVVSHLDKGAVLCHKIFNLHIIYTSGTYMTQVTFPVVSLHL